MARDQRETLMNLVSRALAPTGEADHEATAAAVKACELLRAHPDLVTTDRPSDGPRAPARKGGFAKIHPEAEKLRAWRALMRQLDLKTEQALRATLCADCGRSIDHGEEIIRRAADDIETHAACAGWWWGYPLPPDADDIPF